MSNFFDNFYSGVADLLRLGLSEFPIGAQTAVDLIAQEFCIEAADLCEIFVERNGVSPEEYQAALASNARSGASSAVAHDGLFTDADAERVRSIFADAVVGASMVSPNKEWIQNWQEERSRRRRALSLPPDRNRPSRRRFVLPVKVMPLPENPCEAADSPTKNEDVTSQTVDDEQTANHPLGSLCPTPHLPGINRFLPFVAPYGAAATFVLTCAMAVVAYAIENDKKGAQSVISAGAIALYGVVALFVVIWLYGNERMQKTVSPIPDTGMAAGQAQCDAVPEEFLIEVWRALANWDEIATIIQRYGGVLETTARLGIKDVKMLPYPKETVLDAICWGIMLANDNESRRDMILGASGLADFQEGIGAPATPLFAIDAVPSNEDDQVQKSRYMTGNIERYCDLLPLTLQDSVRIATRTSQALEKREMAKKAVALIVKRVKNSKVST